MWRWGGGEKVDDGREGGREGGRRSCWCGWVLGGEGQRGAVLCGALVLFASLQQ